MLVIIFTTDIKRGGFRTFPNASAQYLHISNSVLYLLFQQALVSDVNNWYVTPYSVVRFH
jgi:hypothetical protein